MSNEEELKGYDKKIYSFTPQEIAKLMAWDTQIQLGAVAETVLAGILRTECLKRVGVKESRDVKVDYDFVSNQFTAYIPKIWCSTHNDRKAEFSYENKPYCLECAEGIKKQLAEKKIEEKKKPERKKK